MNPPAPVLYAEDDENDVFFMQRAFALAGISHPLRIVPNGRMALDYLLGEGVFKDRQEHPLPCLLLLDLNMPGKSGHQVLQAVRGQASLASLPVIIVTSSNQERDIQRANDLGANDYLIKPGDPEDLLRLVRAIHERWLR